MLFIKNGGGRGNELGPMVFHYAEKLWVVRWVVEVFDHGQVTQTSLLTIYAVTSSLKWLQGRDDPQGDATKPQGPGPAECFVKASGFCVISPLGW